MKKSLSKVVGITVLASLLAVSGVGCGNSNADASAEAMPEDAAAVKDEAANTVEAWGSVSAETIKEIHLGFDAMVTKIYVKEGQQIKQGDKLLSIDYDEYKDSIAQKQKQLDLDQESYEGQLKSDTSSQEQINDLQKQISDIRKRVADGSDSEIAELKSAIDKSKTDIKRYEKDLEDQKALVESGTGLQKDVDDINKKIEDAKRDISTAEKKIENKKKDRETEIQKLNSQIATLRDTINENSKTNQTTKNSSAIKKQISDLEVQQMKSKYTKNYIQGNDVILDIPRGVVKSVKVVEGSKIGGETNCLLEIIDEDSLVVKANVSEEFIKDIKVGADAEIVPYADREAVIKGKVKEIENLAIDQNGETVIPIIVEATEKSPYLKYGYGADVQIHTN